MLKRLIAFSLDNAALVLVLLLGGIGFIAIRRQHAAS